MKRAAWLNSLMSANLLSINPSKTEYLVIGLPQQTANVNNPSLAIDSNNVLQPVSYRLPVILNSSLTITSVLISKFQHYLVPAPIIYVTSNASDRLSTSTLPTSLLLHLFNPNLTTGIRSTSTASTNFKSFRTTWPVQSHQKENSTTSLQHSVPCTGSKSKNASTTK